MKQLMFILIVLVVLVAGCSSKETEDAKIKLKQCYESKCELIIDEDDIHLELDYPFDFCYYEARKPCIEKFSDYFSQKFCDNFTYNEMCYEDLAVIKKDNEICYDSQKPSKDDEFFKEYLKEYPDRDEDELFEEYSKELREFMGEGFCSQYYESAIRTIQSGNSHCEGTPSGDYHCYAELISKFSNIFECDEYRDLLKTDQFGISDYEDFRANNCYWWFAATHDDVSVCNELNTQEEKDHCISGYANAKHDSSFCNSISDPDKQSSCTSRANNKMPYCTDYYGVEKCYGTL